MESYIGISLVAYAVVVAFAYWYLNIYKQDGKMKSGFREFGKYKTCKVCKRDRLRSSFYAHPNTKDKVFYTCKFCLRDMQKGIKVKPEPLSVGQRIKKYFEANYDKN